MLHYSNDSMLSMTKIGGKRSLLSKQYTDVNPCFCNLDYVDCWDKTSGNTFFHTVQYRMTSKLYIVFMCVCHTGVKINTTCSHESKTFKCANKLNQIPVSVYHHISYPLLRTAMMHCFRMH